MGDHDLEFPYSQGSLGSERHPLALRVSELDWVGTKGAATFAEGGVLVKDGINEWVK